MKLNRLIATAGAFLFAGLVGSQSAVAKLNEDFSYEDESTKTTQSFSDHFETIQESAAVATQLKNKPHQRDNGEKRTIEDYQTARVEGAEAQFFVVSVTKDVEVGLIKANREGRVFHHIFDGQSYLWGEEQYCPGIAVGTNHLAIGVLLKAIPVETEIDGEKKKLGYVVGEAGIQYLKEIVSGKDISDVGSIKRAQKKECGWEGTILNLTKAYHTQDGTQYPAICSKETGLTAATDDTLTALLKQEAELKDAAKKKAEELAAANKP